MPAVGVASKLLVSRARSGVRGDFQDGNLVASPFAPGPAAMPPSAGLSKNPRRAKEFIMSKEQDNKAIVGRWFTEFWGNPWNPKVVDELAAPDILLQYSLHEPRRGREDVKKFMFGFREAFPDLEFGGAADLIAEGDYVVGR